MQRQFPSAQPLHRRGGGRQRRQLHASALPAAWQRRRQLLPVLSSTPLQCARAPPPPPCAATLTLPFPLLRRLLQSLQQAQQHTNIIRVLNGTILLRLCCRAARRRCIQDRGTTAAMPPCAAVASPLPQPAENGSVGAPKRRCHRRRHRALCCVIVAADKGHGSDGMRSSDDDTSKVCTAATAARRRYAPERAQGGIAPVATEAPLPSTEGVVPAALAAAAAAAWAGVAEASGGGGGGGGSSSKCAIRHLLQEFWRHRGPCGGVGAGEGGGVSQYSGR